MAIQARDENELRRIIAGYIRNANRLHEALDISRERMDDIARRIESGQIKLHHVESNSSLVANPESGEEHIADIHLEHGKPEVMVGNNSARLQQETSAFTILGSQQRFTKVGFTTVDPTGSLTGQVSDMEPGGGIQMVSRAHAIVVVHRDPSGRERVLVGHLPAANSTEIRPHDVSKPRRVLAP
jgi:hypothetical protein